MIAALLLAATTVAVPQGTLRCTSTDGVTACRGIPYAAPLSSDAAPGLFSRAISMSAPISAAIVRVGAAV